MWIESEPGWVDVDDGVGQVGDVVEKLVVCNLGDAVRPCHGQRIIDTESDLGHETVSHPPRSDLGHVNDSVNRGYYVCDANDDVRIDCIKQTLSHAPSGLVADNQDRSRDHQSHHCIRPLRTEHHGDGPDEHQQRGDAVSARVDTVGLQSSRADAAAERMRY